ncbi:MAG: efflux RND transporter periplasmic adaptor subunit [Pirellulaceae bacterium]
MFAQLGWIGVFASKSLFVVATVLACLWAIGFAQRQGWFGANTTATASKSTAGNHRYVCPMMCVPPTSQPGRCPVCGMELVEATSGGGDQQPGVSIEPAARRMIGIRTAKVTSDQVVRTLRTIGSIEYDESGLSTIAAYTSGRLEKLFADYEGVPVSAGDDLAVLYSPELYTAQAEFLSANQSNATSRFVDANRMQTLAAEKLSELGMTDKQIETLARQGKPESRIRIASPQSGTVVEKLAVEGDYVKTGQPIYRVANLASVWLMLDLFPDDAAVVRFGQQVEAEISSAPGKVFSGRIAFISPTVDRKTRTVSVRVEMQNDDGLLKPGDFADAKILVPAIPRKQTYDPDLAGKFISPMHPQIIRDVPGVCPICDMPLISTSELGFSPSPLPEPTVITVPRSAVLMASDHSVVYVESEPGRFELRQIEVSSLTQDQAIVAAGLAEGEVVATDGNFLIDSQSQLAGKPSLLDPSEAPRYPPGPLLFDMGNPQTLADRAAEALDRVFTYYFAIQKSLALDTVPEQQDVDQLRAALTDLLGAKQLPDAAQILFQQALNSIERTGATLEDARRTFRPISHALIKATNLVRTPKTRNSVYHFYCSMVVGGGGDWLQNDDTLLNPYWGSQMLHCGELVHDLSLDPNHSTTQSDQE